MYNAPLFTSISQRWQYEDEREALETACDDIERRLFAAPELREVARERLAVINMMVGGM